MKKDLLKEELGRMRKLAGIINENSFLEDVNITEAQDVMVADMKEEAQGLMIEVKDSLDFASAKLYGLQKMASAIIMDYPELSIYISGTVEPMMEAFEKTYPTQLKELLKKFH